MALELRGLLRMAFSTAGMASLLALCASASADELLIDFAKPGAEALVKANGKSEATGFAIVDAGGAKALEVVCHAGDESYPGVVIMPGNGNAWDLSAFAFIEVKGTNLSDKPLSLNIRIDNDGDWRDNPWNSNNFAVPAGKTAVGKVYFGFSYGKPAYKLDASKVAKILVFTGRSNDERKFGIDAIQASGISGETPAGFIRSVKPAGGLLADFSSGGFAQQLEARGAEAALSGGALLTKASSGSKERSPSIACKAPQGTSLDLSEFTQVDFNVKNEGPAPLRVVCRVDGRNCDGKDNCAFGEAALQPGERKRVSVPFASGKPWTKGEKGSGSRLSSCDVVGFLVSIDKGSQDAKISIDSVKAGVKTAELPSWLGKRPPVDGDWKLTFEDNFDGNSIDQSKWSFYGPNYWDKQSHWSKDNVIVEGGLAKLRYERKTGFHNDDPKGKRSDYAAGFLESYGKWTQRYGYFEARMKIPSAPGLWPAFWLMPDRGESAGPQWKRQDTANGGMEFDVMENLTRWGANRYNIAMHWDGYMEAHKIGGHDRIYAEPDKDGFITCGLLWIPGLAVYYCNGKEVLRWDDARVSSIQSDMMFTLPQGGWDNNAIDDSKLPADFVIDYVRVWQRADLGALKDAK